MYKQKQNFYELILMDIQMPIMDGYEATKEIRKINKNIPIVALSANALKRDMEISKNIGMNDHLNKPIETEKLFAILLKYISKKIDIDLLNANRKIEKLPKLKHLKIESIVPNTIDSFDLYKNIVNGFYNQYKDMIFDLEQVDFNDIFHSFKGLCGTIGAIELYSLAITFEQNSNKVDLKIIQEKLIDVLDEIEQNLLCNNHNDSLKKEKKEDEILELFEELKKVLVTQRPKRINPIISELKDIKLNKEQKLIFETVVSHIEKYEFDEAIDVLE